MDTPYYLQPGAPTVEDYLRLRRDAGLTEPTSDQIQRGIDGAWAAFHAIHRPTGETVGMGRVISDGGTYFHIIDMAVLPTHQRHGIGDAILDALLLAIDNASPNAQVNLLGDPPGWKLYKRHGFIETAPDTIGMRRPFPIARARVDVKG
jgi:ribosomal protein S18 acetylase RimI-like enzyme